MWLSFQIDTKKLALKEGAQALVVPSLGPAVSQLAFEFGVSSMASEHLSGPQEAEAGLGPAKTPSAARKGQSGQHTSVLHIFILWW